jgi:hypothetical protein
LENWVFGPRRVEVIGKWKRLNNDELHNRHSSSNIILVIKSRLGRYACHDKFYIHSGGSLEYNINDYDYVAFTG